MSFFFSLHRPNSFFVCCTTHGWCFHKLSETVCHNFTSPIVLWETMRLRLKRGDRFLIAAIGKQPRWKIRTIAEKFLCESGHFFCTKPEMWILMHLCVSKFGCCAHCAALRYFHTRTSLCRHSLHHSFTLIETPSTARINKSRRGKKNQTSWILVQTRQKVAPTC